MKKSNKIAIIIAIIVVLAIAVFMVFNSLNKEKESITADNFKISMQSKGFYITDATNQFSNYDYVQQAYIASSNDNSYQIEFYVLSNDSYATSFYNRNKSIFEASKGSSSAQTSVNLKNHSKYTLSSGNKYQVVSRINNTVMYINVASEYKDIVKNILNEIGY